MTSSGKIHLYTIWNPEVCATTIKEHIDVRSREGAVKWLVLYDDNIWVAEKDKPLNLRALSQPRTIFKNALGKSDIKNINSQAKNETLLFMQCMDLFHQPWPLSVGLIKEIQIVSNRTIDRRDPLIPQFYHEVIAERGLRPHYSITLFHIQEAKLVEVSNLNPSAEFHSGKFPYPYPIVVTQLTPKSLFDSTGLLDELEIVHEYEPVSRRTCWYVKRPKSIKGSKPLTLGKKKELELIKCFEGKESRTISNITIAKKLYGDIEAQPVQNLVYQINMKFRKHYHMDLIKLGGGRYNVQVKKIILPLTSEL